MAAFEWSDRLDIGVKSMNDEHKVLIGLMNDLQAANARQAPHAELRLLLDKLAHYTVQHFADEEAYFDSISFPDAKTHKAIHKDLLNRLSQQKEAFERSGGAVPDSLFAFLTLWLNAHISGIDMKYGKHARAKQVA